VLLVVRRLLLGIVFVVLVIDLVLGHATDEIFDVGVVILVVIFFLVIDIVILVVVVVFSFLLDIVVICVSVVVDAIIKVVIGSGRVAPITSDVTFITVVMVRASVRHRAGRMIESADELRAVAAAADGGRGWRDASGRGSR